MYIYGGGFVSGSASFSKGYSSMLAKYSGCKVIAVNYALAPEYPFPKGFDDCYNAFCEIARLYPDTKIALVGESAGANLCLALTLKVKQMKRVSRVVVHSPIVDFTGSLDRTEHEVNDFTVKEGCLTPLNQIYVAGSKAMVHTFLRCLEILTGFRRRISLAIIMKRFTLTQWHYIKNVSNLMWMWNGIVSVVVVC